MLRSVSASSTTSKAVTPNTAGPTGTIDAAQPAAQPSAPIPIPVLRSGSSSTANGNPHASASPTLPTRRSMSFKGRSSPVPLSISNVANIFIRLRRAHSRAARAGLVSSTSAASASSPLLQTFPSDGAAGPSSPPLSPSAVAFAPSHSGTGAGSGSGSWGSGNKTPLVVSTSGPTPITQLSGVPEGKRAKAQRRDTYVCAGAVDAARLLRLTRDALLLTAQGAGADVLVDESWDCTIYGPKSSKDNTYRVHINYRANAARSDLKDPRKPVALNQAKGVPGLMTVIQRRE